MKNYYILYYNGNPARGLGEGLTTPHRKKAAYYEILSKVLQLVDTCEHDNEHSGSIKGGEFLD